MLKCSGGIALATAKMHESENCRENVKMPF